MDEDRENLYRIQNDYLFQSITLCNRKYRSIDLYFQFENIFIFILYVEYLVYERYIR